MTTPSSAPIFLSQVAAELGQGGLPFDMERIDARALAQGSLTPGAPYDMTAFYTRTCLNYTVTVGTDGVGNWGFNTLGPTSFGAIAPSALRGLTMRALFIGAGGTEFDLAGVGTAGQSDFFAVILRPATSFTGVPSKVLKSSDASYGIDGFGAIRWSWYGQSGLPGWSALAGQSVLVQVVY